MIWVIEMLSVNFGNIEGYIYNTDLYFKYAYEDDWITNPIVKEIIKDVDKSSVTDANLIFSPVLGMISPLLLSNGVKTLILMLHEPENIFNISTCGDNCAKWILEIGKKLDITVALYHFMDFGSGEFEIRIVNSGKIVRNMKEFVSEAIKYLVPNDK